MSQYFINDDNIKRKTKLLNVKIFDKNYSFVSNNGVFSKNHLDYGSRLLLQNLPIDAMNNNVLDLGCGYGVIGIIIANLNNKVTIDMVDINKEAVILSMQNIKLNKIENATCFESNIYSSVNKKYDYIITNPPIRAGKDIVRKFLINSKDYLTHNGELWFVMRKDHGVKTMLKELEKYFNSMIIKKSNGFYIIKSILH